jgi:hypothetical protein
MLYSLSKFVAYIVLHYYYDKAIGILWRLQDVLFGSHYFDACEVLPDESQSCLKTFYSHSNSLSSVDDVK